MKRNDSWFVLLVLLFLLWALIFWVPEVLDLQWTVFEDGSFRLLGCLPWDICLGR